MLKALLAVLRPRDAQAFVINLGFVDIGGRVNLFFFFLDVKERIQNK